MYLDDKHHDQLAFSFVSYIISDNMDTNQNSQSFFKEHPHFFFCMIAAVLLLLGLFRMPYGYYPFLRFTVSLSSLFLFIFFVEYSNAPRFAWIYLAFASLFNPHSPFHIHFTREIWQAIDIITAAIFLVSGFAIRKIDKRNIPNPPVYLSAELLENSSNNILLKWQRMLPNNAEGFEVVEHVRLASKSYYDNYKVPKNTNSIETREWNHRIKQYSSGSCCSFKVRAFNRDGKSRWTFYVSVNVP